MSVVQDKSVPSNGNEHINAQTFVFNVEEDAPSFTSEMRIKIRQITPAMCGCLYFVVFGLMLGWPSPIYPKLLLKGSPIPISINESAIIASSLMVGAILGFPISLFSPFGSKYSIHSCFLLIICGWALMWQARDTYWLIGSRFLTGISGGYGLRQIKQYIKGVCEQNLAKTLIRYVNFFMIFGIVIAFCIGPYVNFRIFSVIAICVAVVCFSACLFLPQSPIDLVKFGKINQAKKLLHHLKPHLNPDTEVQKIKASLESSSDEISMLGVMKIKVLRKNFVVLALLIFFQQFSGPPSTIVYCQIMFEKFGTPHPEIVAIGYILIFFLSYILGYWCMERYNKKHCLIFSSIFTTIFLVINIMIIYFNLNKKFAYSSVIVMYLFIFFHTIGLGCASFNIIEKIFPRCCIKSVVILQLIVYSGLALTETEVFEVLFIKCPVYVPFIMFACVSLLSIFFVLICIPHTMAVLNISDSEK